MMRLLKKLWQALMYDDMKVRRWFRSWLMAFATGGIAFSDQVAGLLGANSGNLPLWIKGASILCAFISVAINLGEKNEKKGRAG